jgi:iron complex outermembrane receptor protein
MKVWTGIFALTIGLGVAAPAVAAQQHGQRADAGVENHGEAAQSAQAGQPGPREARSAHGPAPTQSAAVSLSLSGHVTDQQGAAVGGASVRLSREDGGVRQTVSDTAGTYTFTAVPAGTIVVEIEKAGFRRQVQVVTLLRDHAAALDVQLDIAGIDDGVVVTATGRPQDTRETSKPLTTIDAQEIQHRNESTLTEIIRFTPGVQVRDNGGPGQTASMRIRGLRADAAAVLIDGLRFRDASTTQSDASSFLSNLNFVAAERVEVLRGSGSSLYGTNAVGGVVNIVTRPGGGPLRGEAQAEAGSLGLTRARGTVSGGALADRLSYSAGVLQFNLRDGLDGHDATRSSGGQGMVRYQINANTSLMGRVFGSGDRVDLNVSPTTTGIPAANIPNAIIVDAVPVSVAEIARANQGLAFDPAAATYIPGRDDPDYRRSSGFVTAAVQLRQTTTSSFSWQGSYQRVHSTRTFRNGPLGAGFQPAAENFGNYAGDIDTVDLRGFLLPTSWLSITAGYEFEREGYFDRQDNNLAGASRLQTETRIAQQAHAAFGEAQFGLLGRRLQISLSGRAQGFRLSSPEFSAVGTRNVYDGLTLDAPSRALTGDISAAYSIAASNTKLRAHGGNAYRAPSLYERFGGGFSTDPVNGTVLFTPYGDPRLRPDRYRSVDGGVDQYFWRDRLLATATVFYTKVLSLTAFDSSGKIRPDTDPFGRAMGYLNGSGGFARGVETGLEARPTASLRLSGSYTYTRSETAQDITVPGFYLVPGVFAHTATFVVTNRWSDRLDTTFDLFHGSQAYGSFFAAGRTRAYRYPAFTKAAIVAGYRLTSSTTRPIRAYVKVDNLFDETYYQGGWRALGRTALAGVSAGF